MSTVRLFLTDGYAATRLNLTSNVPFYQLRGMQGTWDQVRPFSHALINGAAGNFYYEDGFLHLGYNDDSPIVTIPFPWGAGMTTGMVGVGHLELQGPVLTSPGNPMPTGPKVACKVLEAHYDWSNTWVGLGIKGGIQLVSSVAGGRKEGIIGFMVNTSTKQLAFVMVEAHLVDGGRNYGMGGSAGLSVLIATGVGDAKNLTGTPTGGWDVNIAIGAEWSKFFTCLSKARYYQRMLSFLPKALPKVEEIGALGKAAEGSEAYLTWSKSMVVGSGVDPTSRSLSVWDTPIGAGLEISCAETIGSIYYSANVFDVNVARAFLSGKTVARK